MFGAQCTVCAGANDSYYDAVSGLISMAL